VLFDTEMHQYLGVGWLMPVRLMGWRRMPRMRSASSQKVVYCPRLKPAPCAFSSTSSRDAPCSRLATAQAGTSACPSGNRPAFCHLELT
jgi:hypothetical protein